MASEERTGRWRRNRWVAGTARWVGAVAGVALLGFSAPPAVAGEARSSCPGGVEPEGDLGVSGLQCRNCTLTTDGADGSGLWRFTVEPEILALRDGGPAEGVLAEGDRLVAVDGVLITTVEGGRRWSTVPPGERVELRIRRGDRVETVELVAQARCPDAPAERVSERAAPASPSAPGARSERPKTILPRGWLGFGLSCRCTVQSGAESPRWTFREPPRVGGVEEGGPADRAGIREGDLLLEIDGERLTRAAGAERFSTLEPGERVRFTVRRDGERKVLELVAGERPEP